MRMLIGVDQGMGVLDGVDMPQGEEVFAPLVWWHIFNRNVFDSCVKIWQYFHMSEMSVHWLFEEIGSRSKLGFARNLLWEMAKCSSQMTLGRTCYLFFSFISRICKFHYMGHMLYLMPNQQRWSNAGKKFTWQCTSMVVSLLRKWFSWCPCYPSPLDY